MRELTKVPDLGWDDPVPDQLADLFRTELRNIVLLPDVKFKRSVKPSGVTGPPELVCFWDVGEPAFGTVLYVRYKMIKAGPNDETHVATLLASKARVTPLVR